MNENDSATNNQAQPGSELMLEVFEAITRRDWKRLPDLIQGDIEVVVRAGPEVDLDTNQHIWRAVHVQGRQQLEAYIGAFLEALPSVSFISETEATEGDCAWVNTAACGVDNEGLPFDARAIIEFCAVEGKVSSVRADIFDIVRGPGLLTEPDGDPRRFFHPFLDSAPAA